ncbi:MAG: ATP-binding protein [Candidatus Uhrbacteria bacterium]
MLNELKQSGAKVTDLFSRQFHCSRLMLTAMYVIILAVILFSSGTITRAIFSQRLDMRFDRWEIYSDGVIGRLPPPRIDDVRDDLQEVTFFVNGLLLLVAGILSYWLAGLTLQPIQAAYNKQRQFLSDASHELRTPLAILQTDLENEMSKAQSPDERLATESHLEEVKRMGRLVNDLLILSRLDGGESPAEKNRPVDFSMITRETVDRLQSIAKKFKVTLTLIQDDNFSLSVLAPSKDLLVQAITNVINNAIIYNKETGQVTVSTSVDGHTAIIKVVDTGVGITKEEAEKVFDRFYRAEKSRSRQTGGSGLGLSIVQSIINSLGGSITLTSELEKGTTVVITLPLHKTS